MAQPTQLYIKLKVEVRKKSKIDLKVRSNLANIQIRFQT